MMRRALISGCALALLASEAMAQDTSTAAQAPQTPAAAAPAPETPAPTAPAAPETAATPPAPAAPAPATQAAAPGMRMLRGRTFDKASNEGVPLARVIIKGTKKGVE